MAPASEKVRRKIVLTFSVFFLVIAFLVSAAPRTQIGPPQPTSLQQPAAISASASSQNSPEMTSEESATTFRVNVRLVEVHVVVRDSHGQPTGTLRKDDFQLFDDGKVQVITQFQVEKPGQQVALEQRTSEPQSVVTAPLPDIAERYVAYLFDDVHISLNDFVPVREAAVKNVDTLERTDRAAILTTSGQGEVDFTDDRNKLHEALRRMLPHPLVASIGSECPKMTYYIADAIQNQNDQQALAAVAADVLACEFNNDSRFKTVAQSTAQAAAARGIATGDAETHLSLTSIKDAVRRLATVPGQRSIVLVSPGFIIPQQQFDVDSIIDRAIRGNITINALDARGLYVIVPGGDISERGPSNPVTGALELQYQQANALADSDVMAELADGTGGTFFHNNNDLQEGFRRVASAPEYYYVLGFSPQHLKLNGGFHKLRVTVKTKEKVSIQARRGYFAPKQEPSPEQQAKQDIEDEVFSQDEIRQLPIELHTQFFKENDTQAKLTVLAHVDVKQLHFLKAGGRNNNNLTIVSVVFDGNGNLVTGIEKTVQLHLKDETLAYKLGSGLNVRSTLNVKPGNYLVRLVVRDADGQLAAQNGAVQIP